MHSTKPLVYEIWLQMVPSGKVYLAFNRASACKTMELFENEHHHESSHYSLPLGFESVQKKNKM